MTDKEILEEIEYNVLNDPFTTFSQDSSYESVQIKATAIEELVKRFKEQQKEIEELGNRKAENYYHWQHLEAKIINKMKELEEMPENQYIHLHYIKKMLRELLGE